MIVTVGVKFVTKKEVTTMAKNPVLPLYYADLNQSTNTWTDEEFGAYMRLLIYQWDQGFIPKDPKKLKKIANSFKKNKEILLKKFIEINGVLKNNRMENIRIERQQFIEKQSLNAKSRWNSYNSGISQNDAKLDAKPMPPSPSPSLLPLKEKPPTPLKGGLDSHEKKNQGGKLQVENSFSPGFLTAWNSWKKYKAAEHKFHFKSPESENLALKELFTFSGGDEKIAEQIIQKSISNGWKGLFELKNQKNGTHFKTPGSKLSGAIIRDKKPTIL